MKLKKSFKILIGLIIIGGSVLALMDLYEINRKVFNYTAILFISISYLVLFTKNIPK